MYDCWYINFIQLQPDWILIKCYISVSYQVTCYHVLWPLWSVKTNVYCQVDIKVTVSTIWLRVFSVVNCTNLFIFAQWAAAGSCSGALHLQFPLQLTTQPQWRREHVCWRHPGPSNMSSTVRSHCSIPSPTHCIAGVWASDCFQMNAVVSEVHFACCLGRMDSSDYRPWVSMTILVSFTDWVTVLGVHRYSPTLETSHVMWVNAEAGRVLCDGDESVSDLRECTPCIPCCLLF